MENGSELAAAHSFREIRRDVRQNIDAHQIGKAKGSGARPADGGAGQRVDLFDRESLLQHQVPGVEHDRNADAIGDEVGRVVRRDHLLAERAVGKGGECGDQRGIGLRRRDHFDKAHIARRIEEVRAEEPAAHIGNRGGDARDGQAGGVAGEDGARRKVRHNALEQGGLDLEIFGDGFDDPIALREPGQVIVESARRDQAAERRFKEGRGFRLGKCFERDEGKRPLRGLILWRKVE